MNTRARILRSKNPLEITEKKSIKLQFSERTERGCLTHEYIDCREGRGGVEDESTKSTRGTEGEGRERISVPVQMCYL